jgi:uncharacterized protein (TIGR00251 family)
MYTKEFLEACVKNGGVISVKVTPKAKKTQILCPREDIFKIAVTAPRTEGKANRMLLSFVKTITNASFVEIISGEFSEIKTLRIE